ncbi:hypothetical protein [Spiroplasma culicicola]|uniref:Uncharacterized protein n=1 Tax=Spiroplasma culicicola AES-1 TaxID=1276246 RepID=W6A6J2_9MOLU|nr:hypothetical protein [Spiroplasma culicicola]AHI52622.1 hypothetical protein SCULI_v1c02810 [Spiroplasma culicicola AES-1]
MQKNVKFAFFLTITILGGVFIKELTKSQKISVKAGAGSLSTIIKETTNLVKSGFEFIENIFTYTVGTVFLFQHANDYDKLEIKMGNTSIKYDNSASNKAEIENQSQIPEPVLLI